MSTHAEQGGTTLASRLGNWRLEGWRALAFVLGAFALASAIRWFLLGELSVRLLFPSFLLAVVMTTWVAGVRAGVLGIAITVLTGLFVYGQDDSGLTLRDFYSLGFVLLICCMSVFLVYKARRTRDQLWAGRRWYGNLLDHSTEVVGFIARNGTLRYLNRSGHELWGIGEEALGRRARDVLPMQRDGMAFSLDTVSSGAQRGMPRHALPSGLCAKQGDQWIPVTGSVTHIQDPVHGKGLVFSLQWDEALRKATCELEVTRQHLDALLEADVVGVAALDSDGRLHSPNRAFLAMIGVAEGSPAAAALRLPQIIVGGPAHLSGMQRTARDTRLRRTDGSTVWVALSLASTGPDEGLLLATRIDDRKRAEQDANFGRQLLQTIIDEVPAVIAFLRPCGRIDVINRHACSLFAGEETCDAPGCVLPGIVREQLQPALDAAWHGEESRVMLQIPGEGKEPRHLQTQLIPCKSDDGSISGIVLHAFDLTDRLEREQQLMESEYRFRRLAEAFAAVVWQATEDGRLINEFGWMDFTGINSGHAIDDWAAAVHPEDIPLLHQFQAEMTQATGRRDIELRLAYREGGYRHVALKGIPLEDRARTPRRWIGCIRDIHSQKHYAAALAARESELRLILETVPVRLAYIDSCNRFQWCNGAFADWFGISEDVSGLALEAVLPEPVIATLAGAMEQAHQGRMTSLEWRSLHPQKGWCWTSTSFTPELEVDGKVRGVITLCVDCTERREREASLKRSVAQHKALVENVPHMVWITDPEGKVEYFNQRWYDFTGLGPDSHWTDAIHLEEREEALALFNRIRAYGHEFDLEVRYRRGQHGEYRWHLVRAIPLRYEDGGIIRWYGTCTDIHDQKAAQEALRDAQSRTDRFLATLSHELRNPLAALLSSFHVLEHQEADELRRQDAHRTIRRQATHLKRLVDDLLDINRINLGKVPLRLRTFDLRQLCIDTCTDFAALATERRIHLLHTSRRDTPLWVLGDPARIRQCLDNLVSNAIKASTAGGEVSICADVIDSQIQIVVEDEGIGIPPDMLTRIFQPFAQGDDWHEKGLGLGLSIVQKMIELHEGCIEAESAGPGQGSRFVIRLKHDSGLAPAIDDEPSPPSRYRERRRGTLLLVDDERDSVSALQYLLELEGYEVHCALDGESALRLAAQVRPQVVICDIGLPPPLTGLDVARHLRACADWPLHLIAYSGYGTQQDVEYARAVGFDSHLTKPCNPATLIDEADKGLRACLHACTADMDLVRGHTPAGIGSWHG